MNILITGGAGFIGSHLSERLLNEGNRVICFDNFNESINKEYKYRNINDIKCHYDYKLVDGDVRNIGELGSIFSQEEIDVVIHLAAQTGVRPSVQNPVLHYKVNVLGTVNVLQACVRHRIRKLVFASSSSIYGCNSKFPFSEDDKTDNQLSPYAATKKAGENICFVFHKLYKLNVVCIRPFTVYGPRQRKEMAISLFTRQIYNDEVITIFGDESNSRDYTYVSDAVDGFVKAIGINGYKIFNTGGGKPITLKSLISMIEERVGKKARINYGSMQPGEVYHTCADTTKSLNELGYSAKVPIEEGLDKYVKWYLREVENV